MHVTVPPTCGPNEFQCKTDQCVHSAWKCDGEVECEDGSDEENCPGCESDQYQCANKQCVARKELCKDHSCTSTPGSCGEEEHFLLLFASVQRYA